LIGLAVIAGVALYIGIFWLILRALKQGWAKALAVLIALAIPFWDLPIGYKSFTSLCAEQGGIRVLTKLPPQKSVLFASATGLKPAQLLIKGLQFVEYKTPNGKITRFTKSSNGHIEESDVSSSASLVLIRTTYNDLLTWNVYRNESSLVDAWTNRTIATATSFYWLGGWLQRRMSPIFAGNGRCHADTQSEIMDIVLRGST
jgi:hypothetical protein